MVEVEATEKQESVREKVGWVLRAMLYVGEGVNGIVLNGPPGVTGRESMSRGVVMGARV